MTQQENVIARWLIARLLRRLESRLGHDQAADLAETLASRQHDAARLPAVRSGLWYLRELRALWRAGSGSAYPISQLPRGSVGRLQVRDVVREFRYAGRQLLRAPGTAVAAVTILALGIGASTAIFTVVNAVLLQPLPYPAPEQIFRISNQNSRNAFNTSVACFLGLREQDELFERIAGYTSNGSSWYRQTFTMTLTAEAEPRVLEGTWVTAGYFEVLGVEPLLGRTILPGEDRFEADPVVVISHGLWQRQYGGAADVLGKSLEINGIAHTVVGVMPAGFHPLGNADAEVWPAFRLQEPGRRGPFFITVIGRLAPGRTIDEAEAALAAVQQDLRVRWSDSFNASDTRFVTSPISREVIGDVGATLWPLLGAVALVLLIALANVANLVLSRSARRDQEFALRVALGAGRGRLIVQLLAEGALLAFAGALAGLALAAGLLDLLVTLAPAQLPRQAEIALDARVLAVSLALAIVAALAFGLAPARHAASRRLSVNLQAATRSSTQGVSGMRLRRGLVVAEFALAVPLLVGALVMISSLLSLQGVDPGFDVGGVLTMRIALAVEQYNSITELMTTYDELLSRSAAVAGVEGAALSSSLPPSNLVTRNNFVIRHSEPVDGTEVAHYMSVSSGYFQTLRVPLIRGRSFLADDHIDAPMVAIVDTAFEQRYLDGESALGIEMQFGGCSQCPWATVVGVAGPVRYRGPGEAPDATIYVPLAQEPQSNFYLSLRTAAEPEGLVTAVRQAVVGAAAGVAPTRVRTMAGLLTASVAAPRYRMLVLALFAGVAVLLAAVGVYAVMAAFVTQQTREVGVRMALGASRSSVVRFVLQRVAVLLAAGVGAGVLLAIASGRLLRALAYGIDPSSPLLVGAAATVLALVAAGATWFPALKASRVNPVTALRAD